MKRDVRLCEALDKLLERGVVISGDVRLCLAGIDLVYIRLGILLTSAENLTTLTGESHANRTS